MNKVIKTQQNLSKFMFNRNKIIKDFNSINNEITKINKFWSLLLLLYLAFNLAIINLSLYITLISKSNVQAKFVFTIAAILNSGLTFFSILNIPSQIAFEFKQANKFIISLIVRKLFRNSIEYKIKV